MYERKYSRNKINQAGRLFSGKEVSGLSKNDAKEILEDFRISHVHPLGLWRKLLERKLRTLSHKALVSQRLKRIPSIINKLEEADSMKLYRMQDIAGLRVVLDTMNQVYDLRDLIRESESEPKFQSRFKKEDDYIKNPPSSGYRSLHLIYEHKNKDEKQGCLIEIQIRTKVQHAWATTVEVLGTYSNQRLKQSKGDPETLALLKEISELFQNYEEGKINYLSVYLVFKKMNKLNLKVKLGGFIEFTDNLQSIQSSKDNYFLMKLMIQKKEIYIKSFSKSQSTEAIEAYTDMENKFSKNKDVEVVLVSVKDVNNLKALYPNYFLDTQEFFDLINNIRLRYNKKIFSKVFRLP